MMELLIVVCRATAVWICCSYKLLVVHEAYGVNVQPQQLQAECRRTDKSTSVSAAERPEKKKNCHCLSAAHAASCGRWCCCCCTCSTYVVLFVIIEPMYAPARCVSASLRCVCVLLPKISNPHTFRLIYCKVIFP